MVDDVIEIIGWVCDLIVLRAASTCDTVYRAKNTDPEDSSLARCDFKVEKQFRVQQCERHKDECEGSGDEGDK
jgi:hypothetical protein